MLGALAQSEGGCRDASEGTSAAGRGEMVAQPGLTTIETQGSEWTEIHFEGEINRTWILAQLKGRWE